MDEKLKRRLVGATVLVSLAIIFLPILFEQRPPEQKQISLGYIPSSPDRRFDSSLLEDEVPAPVPLAPISSSDTITADNKPEPITAKTPRVGLSAWVVQVGSFSSMENAQKLVDKLRQAGFDTLDPARVDIQGKSLYRVRVGPEIEKENAERQIPEIEKLVGSKVRIVRHP